MLEQAWNAIGDYYADRQKWQNAVTYYVQGRNQERLAECYYMLEDYAGLETMSSNLPENHPLHAEIAEMFKTVGMCEQAVASYSKLAKETCDPRTNPMRGKKLYVLAALLVEEYHEHVKQSSMKTAGGKDKRNKREAEQCIYQEAYHFFLLAQRQLYEGAIDASMKTVEEYHEHVKQSSMKTAGGKDKRNKREAEQCIYQEAISALAGLLEEDSMATEESKVVDNAWRGAEAYHFFLLAQRQLYEGAIDASMKTVLANPTSNLLSEITHLA
ncbi:predicted protein [Nematostella vectensis]|uniref:IFT121-like TPR repeats domain-containing protein n=1 Tax=Nematostella vectensis TaxID=45351 RepID=A7T0U7_NEMVE|nr:predicted protein [Nematostella vectensis]|eukprot:XP_001622515.1 predicted protein [Nematostella vectensis]